MEFHDSSLLLLSGVIAYVLMRMCQRMRHKAASTPPEQLLVHDERVHQIDCTLYGMWLERCTRTHTEIVDFLQNNPNVDIANEEMRKMLKRHICSLESLLECRKEDYAQDLYWERIISFGVHGHYLDAEGKLCYQFPDFPEHLTIGSKYPA